MLIGLLNICAMQARRTRVGSLKKTPHDTGVAFLAVYVVLPVDLSTSG